MSLPGSDIVIAAITVFVLAFAVLSGAALNPLNRPGQHALKTALIVRLCLSAVLAALAAAWVAHKT